jgi:hypothetical protein
MQPVELGPSAADETLRTYADRVAILIPSFGDCTMRRQNQKYVLRWYAQRGFTCYLGTDNRSETGFFSRTRAINNAARTAHAAQHKNIYVIADNDLIPSASHLSEALEQAANYPAVIPHKTTLYTSHLGRTDIFNDHRTYRYQEKIVGSLSYIVISAEAFERVNGMDECFEGWGPEDQAFVQSIQHQLGDLLRLDGARTHLWHPIDNSKRDRKQLMRNRARFQQYLQGNKETATVLAREYGDWLGRDQ